ncbi:MAG: maltose ABC transporter substrate-binding protein [Lachnospiraceae bacterium]|jgi:arabinogalactan oligomer/maltooligosaccharide transport system substrate-binding protein|nr:maltose ABC transporter substrate-binding protein [Lachnospiraceae bacterium]
MKRKVIALLLATSLTAVLIGGGGCGGDDSVTLTVWESTQGPDEFIRQAGAAYTEKNPNVTINYVNVELGDSVSQIALDGPAGVGPDLFAAPHDRLGSLVVDGHVVPVADAGLAGRVLASCATAVTFNGVMYGYPVSAETYALYYNRALINEADVPTTWDGLKAWSMDFNAANPGSYGFIMDIGAYYVIIFTTSDNNRLFGPSGTDTTATNINSAASVKGMQFFASLRDALPVPAADLNTATADANFIGGNAAMTISGPWNVGNFTSAGLDFGITTLPSLPGESNPPASFSGTRSMFVSAYSENIDEAHKFAAFLVSEEMQTLRYNITGALPAVDVPLSSPHDGAFVKQLEYAFPMPSIPEMGRYWDAMNNAASNIWDGANIEAELDAANAAILN